MKYFIALFMVLSVNFQALAQLKDLAELEKMKGPKTMEEALVDPQSVVKLDLSGNKLYGVDLEINRLVNLQYLDLSKNELRDFPIEVTKLVNLQYLQLGRNKITKIPDEIARLENLKFLGMSRNDLYLISPEMGKLKKMEEFDLWDNPIKEFPEEIRQMSSLKKLDLRVVQINEKEKKRLMKMFPYTDIKFSKTCDCD
ncbi:MAG: leucine-rich repeat domain-containing protein [Vicingaceae bacterium]